MSVQYRGTEEDRGSIERNYSDVSLDSSVYANSEAGERLGLLARSVEVPRTPQGSSWYASIFLVVNAALGAGLLNFPKAYDQSGGILVAIVTQAVLMVFIYGALLILAFCSDVNGSNNYQDVVLTICGKVVQQLCAATIALYCFGTCITFLVIIGDQLDKFFTFIYGDDYCLQWYMNRKFTLVVTTLLFILPICFPKRIDFLKYVSFLGVIAVLYCVVLVTVKYFIGPINPGPIKTSPQTWSDVFLVIPVICFGYQCHVSVIPIYSCFQHRNLKSFSKTITVALGLCLLSYTGTASFGYLTFGSDINPDILLSYKPTPDVLIAVFMIAAKMYTTYPILLFVGRAALLSLWTELWKMSPAAVEMREKPRRIITTTIWFCASLLLALVVPNITQVISVLGGLAATFIFIFPGLCLLQTLLKEYIDLNGSLWKYYFLLGMAICYLVIGTFLFGVTTTQAIMNDIKDGSPSKPLTVCA